jgi:hypothetical protein
MTAAGGNLAAAIAARAPAAERKQVKCMRYSNGCRIKPKERAALVSRRCFVPAQHRNTQNAANCLQRLGCSTVNHASLLLNAPVVAKSY